MFFYIFIPTTWVGWKYCFKHPSNFFRMGSHRRVEELYYKALIKARRRYEAQWNAANIAWNEAYSAQKEAIAELKRIKRSGWDNV